VSTLNSNEFQAQTQQIERLVEQVSAFPDGEMRTAALDLVQALMDLHGAGISRIVELLSESGETGRKSLNSLASDSLVCGLLVLYGVHPVALSDRVNAAIEKARPQIQKQGGTVELLGVNEGQVRLSITSSGSGCHSSPDSLKEAVEQAIREAAPEIVEVIAEGVSSSSSAFLPVNMIQPAMKEEQRYEKSSA
jgi:Fe-S cluster biogenesis protein NfuA